MKTNFKSLLVIFIIFLTITPAQLSSVPMDATLLKEIDSRRPLRVDELLIIVSDFQKIINKRYPTYGDYLYLNPLPNESDNLFYQEYCHNVMKIDKKSQECNDFILKIKRNPDKFSDINLLNIKYNLADQSDSPIKIFVDSNLKKCSVEQARKGDYQNVKAIALIGENKHKQIILLLPCDIYSRYVFSQFSDIQMDGKWTSEWQNKIDKPVPGLEK